MSDFRRWLSFPLTLLVEDEDPQAEDADDADGGRYTVVRQTQFYGLGCEEWLALVVKVSHYPRTYSIKLINSIAAF